MKEKHAYILWTPEQDQAMQQFMTAIQEMNQAVTKWCQEEAQQAQERKDHD